MAHSFDQSSMSFSPSGGTRAPRCPPNYEPLCGEVIHQPTAAACTFVSVDLDAWNSYCRQGAEKTDQVCPVKKLTKKPKAEGGGRARLMAARLAKSGADQGDDLSSEESSIVNTCGHEKMTESELALLGLTSSTLFLGSDFCICPGRPRNKPRPKICRCSPYKPVNFLLQVEVSAEHKPPFVPKLKKQQSS